MIERALSEANEFAECKIDSIARRQSPYQSSYGLDEIDVILGDGRRLRFVYKTTTSDQMTANAAAGKPQFVRSPRREIEVYERLLSRHKLGTPRLYTAVADADTNHFGLLLEFVTGSRLDEVGDESVWHGVAAYLARMHGAFASTSAPSKPLQHLIDYNADFCLLWLDRARTYVRKDAITDRDDGEYWNKLQKDYDSIIERLFNSPQSIIHGDFFAANIIVGPHKRIAVVDWEVAGIGPSLLDLAALVAGKWSEAMKRSFARAYFTAGNTNQNPEDEPKVFAEVLLNLAACRIQLAVQMLGRSNAWRPPPAQQYDWLGEAISQAKVLGL